MVTEIIMTQERFLSSIEPRPTGADILQGWTGRELERRINLILDHWKLVEKGDALAKQDIKNGSLNILLIETPNAWEKEYLDWMSDKHKIRWNLVDRVISSDSKIEKKFFLYGYNSAVAVEILRNYKSYLDFSLAYEPSSSQIFHSRFGITWLFEADTKHWITKDPAK